MAFIPDVFVEENARAAAVEAIYDLIRENKDAILDRLADSSEELQMDSTAVVAQLDQF